MIEIFRGYVKTKDKKPIQKFKGVDNLPTYEELNEKYDEFAGILNDQFTVMDIDDTDEAQRTYRLVCDLGLNCRVTKTTRGMHFIFKKNEYANKGNTHQINALGFTLDIRTGVNQYIVVKKDGVIRPIIREFDETKPITEFPKYFAPIRSSNKFTGFKDGDGRNGKLFGHIATLYNNNFVKEEIIEICKWINDYAFDEPLSDTELKTVYRDEAFINLKRNSALDDFGRPEFKPEEFTDVAMAELFAEKYRGEIRYNPGTDWIVWNGKVWEMSVLQAEQKYIGFLKKVMECAKEEIKNAYAGGKDEVAQKAAQAFYKFVLKMNDSGKVSGVLRLAKSYLQINLVDLDGNPYDLNTPSGIINLKTGQLRPHDPEALCTKITNYSPSKVKSQMWEDFLDVVSVGDKELVEYLQYVMGATVIGKVYNESLVMAYGEGANGKSTLFNSIAKVLGNYAGKIPADVLTTKVQSSKVDLAEILGKRFILASETEEGNRLSNKMLKTLASVDEITGEKKYHDPMTFEPTHQAILYTNFLPSVGSIDKGTWRRLAVVPFLADIKTPQKDFAEKLMENASEAIMQWMIDGAVKFIKNKYNLPKCQKVEEAIETYREENDWVKAFLAECCITGKLEKVQGGQLYRVYRQWCQETGEYARRNRDFAKSLKSYGFEPKRVKTGIVWTGLTLNADRKVANTVEEDFLN